MVLLGAALGASAQAQGPGDGSPLSCLREQVERKLRRHSSRAFSERIHDAFRSVALSSPLGLDGESYRLIEEIEATTHRLHEEALRDPGMNSSEVVLQLKRLNGAEDALAARIGWDRASLLVQLAERYWAADSFNTLALQYEEFAVGRSPLIRNDHLGRIEARSLANALLKTALRFLEVEEIPYRWGLTAEGYEMIVIEPEAKDSSSSRISKIAQELHKKHGAQLTFSPEELLLDGALGLAVERTSRISLSVEGMRILGLDSTGAHEVNHAFEFRLLRQGRYSPFQFQLVKDGSAPKSADWPVGYEAYLSGGEIPAHGKSLAVGLREMEAFKVGTPLWQNRVRWLSTSAEMLDLAVRKSIESLQIARTRIHSGKPFTGQNYLLVAYRMGIPLLDGRILALDLVNPKIVSLTGRISRMSKQHGDWRARRKLEELRAQLKREIVKDIDARITKLETLRGLSKEAAQLGARVGDRSRAVNPKDLERLKKVSNLFEDQVRRLRGEP